MKPRIWIAFIAVVGVGAYLLFHTPSTEEAVAPTDTSQNEVVAPPQEQVVPPEEDESAITNYDDCIAAGNLPLPEASDKCLTKGGHIFIQGVVE